MCTNKISTKEGFKQGVRLDKYLDKKKYKKAFRYGSPVSSIFDMREEKILILSNFTLIYYLSTGRVGFIRKNKLKRL
jgi:hypothetical protein